jgi:D-alanyl-D-alanine carboxypeptidase
MTYRDLSRPKTRSTPSILVPGLLVVIAAITAALGYQSLASSSSTPKSPIQTFRSVYRGAPDDAGGAVPGVTTLFDDEVPEVANLNPDLLRALREAAAAAGDDGVEFFVNSGWRSPAEQEQLFREAVSKYGSEEEAARWVSTPNTSAHVSGDAVDVGPSGATAWLKKHGSKYGLCQIYRNEPWHYELRPTAIEDGCPPLYADPTHDPRTHSGTTPAPPERDRPPRLLNPAQ